MSEMYNTTKWGEVSEEFLLKKKKQASACKAVGRIAIFFLFLAVVDYALLMLTLKGLLSLGFDTQLLLMVFFMLGGCVLLFAVVWLVLSVAFGAAGTKRALAEAREQELERREKKARQTRKAKPRKSHSSDQEEEPEEFQEESSPSGNNEEEDGALSMDDDCQEDDGMLETGHDSMEEPDYGGDDDGDGLDDEDFGDDGDFIDDEGFEEDGGFYQDADEDPADGGEGEDSLPDGDGGFEEPDEEDMEAYQEQPAAREEEPVHLFAANEGAAAGADKPFDEFWDGIRASFAGYLKDKDARIARLEAELANALDERDHAARDRDEAIKARDREADLRMKAESRLEQALAKLQGKDALNETSEFISIELIPPAEVISINMEIKIPTSSAEEKAEA